MVDVDEEIEHEDIFHSHLAAGRILVPGLWLVLVVGGGRGRE